MAKVGDVYYAQKTTDKWICVRAGDGSDADWVKVKDTVEPGTLTSETPCKLPVDATAIKPLRTSRRVIELDDEPDELARLARAHRDFEKNGFS